MALITPSKGQFVYQLVTEGAEKGGLKFKKFTTAIEGVNKKFKETSVATHRVSEYGDRLGETITKKITRPFTGLEIASKKYKMTQSRVRRGLEEMNATVDETGKIWSLTTGEEIKGKKAVQGLTKANERFKMEMLSVMFFGMAISRTFGGMIKQVREMTGVYDMWGAVAIVSLLPFELAIAKISNRLASLVLQSPTLQKIVGGFIEVGKAVGDVFSGVGQISLGIFGVAKAWPTITKAFTTAKDFLLGGMGIPIIVKELGKVLAKINAIKGIGGIAIRFTIYLAIAWLAAKAAKALADFLEKTGWWQWATGAAADALKGIISPETARAGAGFIDKLFEYSGLESKQFGGAIGSTGLYQLHAGERVIPPGGFGGGTNITVNANIASDVDIKKLGDRLATYMNDSFERQHMRRSI